MRSAFRRTGLIIRGAGLVLARKGVMPCRVGVSADTCKKKKERSRWKFNDYDESRDRGCQAISATPDT